MSNGKKSVPVKEIIDPGQGLVDETPEERVAREEEILQLCPKFTIRAAEVIARRAEEASDPEFTKPLTWATDEELAFLRSEIKNLQLLIAQLQKIRKFYRLRLAHLKELVDLLNSAD